MNRIFLLAERAVSALERLASAAERCADAMDWFVAAVENDEVFSHVTPD